MKRVFNGVKSLFQSPTVDQKIEKVSNPKTESMDNSNVNSSLMDDVIDNHNKDGYVIVKDHQIEIFDPEGSGIYPTLVIPEDDRMSIMIDGERSIGKVVVYHSMKIEIIPNDSESQVEFNLISSENKLSLEAQVNVTPGIKNILKDIPKSRNAVLEIESIVESPKQTIQIQMDEKLEKGNYDGELDHQAIEDIIHAESNLTRIILRGKEPKHEINAYYQLFDLPKTLHPLLGKMQIDTVLMGTPVAFRLKGTSGIPGKDIWGKEIPFTILDHIQKLGEGVVEINEKIIARINGRLVFKKYLIDIKPELEVKEEVNSKTGNIEFEGDIVLHSNVLDGCNIKAHGKISVYGNVYSSTLIAEDEIHISGHIIGSTILAGQTNLLYSKIKSLFQQCQSELDKFIHEYDRVVKRATLTRGNEQKIPMIASLLMDQRHPELMKILQEIYSISMDNSINNTKLTELTHLINTKWLGIYRTNILKVDINNLRQSIVSSMEQTEIELSKITSDIRFHSATSSEFRASGNIISDGTGVINSTLDAGKTIVVRGLLRGGFAIAKQAVFVKELGALIGVETSVKVHNSEGKIKIGKRHINTLLDVNGVRNKSNIIENNVIYKER